MNNKQLNALKWKAKSLPPGEQKAIANLAIKMMQTSKSEERKSRMVTKEK